MIKDLYETKMVRKGQVIEGEVVSVTQRSISVDLQTFTEGLMYIEYYTLDKSVSSFDGLVKVGDMISATVTSVNEERGEILLSRLDLAKSESFKKFVEEYKVNDAIKVKVVRKAKKGYIVNAFANNFLLLGSDNEDLAINSIVDVLITDIDLDRNSVIVSKRALERQNALNVRQAEYDALNVGDKVEGIVNSIESYGLFVKLNNINGLINIKELDHTFIKDIKDYFKVGDKIEAVVTAKKDGKLALSRKLAIASPFELYVMDKKVSDVVKASVKTKLPFGVVCTLAENVDGLLHISEISHNPNDNFMASLNYGDELDLAIIAIDAKKNKIGLSRKALIDNPWAKVNAKKGDQIEATIQEINSKGFVISVFGVEGTVSLNEIILDKKSSKLEDYYAVGDQIVAVIEDINTKEWVLTASMRKYQNIVEREQFDAYIEKQESEDKSTTLGDLFKNILK